jgi:hypothetical protein
LVNGNQVQGAQVIDLLASGMSYVEGSAVPEPSFVIAGEMFWDFEPPPPPEGHRVTYQVRPNDLGDELSVSRSSSIQLTYADGTIGDVVLENPEVCVFPVGRPEACEGFGATPTATDSPTADTPPTEPPTTTPSPAPTEDATGSTVYLPSARRP